MTVSRGLRLLDGVRVISLEQYISGPYCTSVLADLGAEVFKVERPDGGDPRRAYEPSVGEGERRISHGFASYNRGKKSVALDLTTPEGVGELRDRLAVADVLVSNLRPGALAKLGLDPAELTDRYPRLIVCEITGFGVTGGPYARRAAFDSVIQAMSGLSSLIGAAPDAPPGLAPMGTMDLLGGIYATMGILAALAGRARTGRGCHVDAAMYDVGAAFLERPLTVHEFTGTVPTRGHDAFSPVATFRAADGRWVAIVIPTDEMWRRTCRAIGREDLVTDPGLDTSLKRADAMTSRIVPLLEEWAAQHDAATAAEILESHGMPAGVVQSIDEVRACPQLAHRDVFRPMPDEAAMRPDGSRIALPRFPLLFDGRGAEPGRVPALGEHRDDWVALTAQQTVHEEQPV